MAMGMTTMLMQIRKLTLINVFVVNVMMMMMSNSARVQRPRT